MPTNRSTDPVVWEDPPGARSRDGMVSHHKAAAILRTKPGRWGIVATYDHATTTASTAGVIRSGRTGAWRPAGHYEAMARTVSGEHRVYARYVGDRNE